MLMHIYADAQQDAYIDQILNIWGYDKSNIRIHSISSFDPANHVEGDYVVVAQLKVVRRFFGENISDCSFFQKDGIHYFCCHSFSYGEYNEGWFTNMSRALYKSHLLVTAGFNVSIPTTYEWLTLSNVAQHIAEVKERGCACIDTETNGLNHYTQKGFRARLFQMSYREGHSLLINLEPLKDHERAKTFLQETVTESDWENEQDFYEYHNNHLVLHEVSKHILLNRDVVKVGHHIKYDMHVLNIMGVGGFEGPIYDTMLIAHMVHQAERRPYGLKPLTADYIPSVKEWTSELDDNVADASIETLVPYAIVDPDATLRLFHYLLPQVLHVEAFVHLLRSLICPTTYTLYDMERNGALVNDQYRKVMAAKAEEYLQKREQEMQNCPDFMRYDIKRRQAAKEQRVKELMEKAQQREADGKHLKKDQTLTVAHQKLLADISAVMSGEVEVAMPFNFASPEQLGEFFYTSPYGLQLPMPYVRGVGKEESGHKPSTKSEYLMLIADKSPVVEHLEAHREISKIKASYLDGFEPFIDSSGRIHANYGQHTVETGRLSCKAPNLQTMPRGSSVGAPDTSEINDAAKSMFIAPDGYDIVQIDFKALELRIMAHFSQDPGMLKVFSDGLDPHTTTAKALSRLTDEEWEQLPKDKKKALRNKGKATNFLLIYQGSVAGFRYASKVAYGVEMTQEEAQESYDMFFQAYPGIHAFHQRQIRQAKNHKYCETLLGRQRTLAYYMNSFEDSKRQHGIRQAINTPCQGAGAEATQFMHGQLYRLLPTVMPGDYMFFNQVHDSIMLYVKEHRIHDFYKVSKQVVSELKDNLADYFHGRTFMNVDLDIDMEHGKTWKALEAYQEEVL